MTRGFAFITVSPGGSPDYSYENGETIMQKRSLLSLTLAVGLILLTTLATIAPRGTARAQVITIIPTFIFPIATPTRTPTPIILGNFVWNDLDRDGRQDTGEPGIPGVTVQLWNSAKTLLIDSTVTNPSGIYSLTAPLPGSYRIRVLLPSGASFSPANQGIDDTKDSDILTSGANFGFTDTINIASNVISITSLDAGIINLPPTPSPTITNTMQPSATPTNTLPGTPQPAMNFQIYLPGIQK